MEAEKKPEFDLRVTFQRAIPTRGPKRGKYCFCVGIEALSPAGAEFLLEHKDQLDQAEANGELSARGLGLFLGIARDVVGLKVDVIDNTEGSK